MNLLKARNWSLPVAIAYGPGRLAEIAKHCGNAGIGKPLVITDRGSAELPFVSQTVEFLTASGLSTKVFADISPNPRDDEIASGRDLYRNEGFDGIIAIGGGSGMDGAKAVCLTAANDIDLWKFEYAKKSPDMTGHAPFPPLICIPTTAGTGAETESTAMITETERSMKFCVWHPQLKPALALLDPEITVGLPSNLTAWTGIDALVHAIEAYCVRTFHPICDGTALEALKLIHKWLPVAVAEPGNLEARGGMQVGACLAGISFLKGLGMVHAVSHMVGADYDTHHGLTNAVALPGVLRFNEESIAEKVPAMSNALGLTTTDFDSFYAAVCKFLDDLDIPKTLADIGVPNDCAREISEKAVQDLAAITNPRRASADEVCELVEYLLTVGR